MESGASIDPLDYPQVCLTCSHGGTGWFGKSWGARCLLTGTRVNPGMAGCAFWSFDTTQADLRLEVYRSLLTGVNPRTVTIKGRR